MGTKEILKGVWLYNPGRRSKNTIPSRSIVSIVCNKVGYLVQVVVYHMAGRGLYYLSYFLFSTISMGVNSYY